MQELKCSIDVETSSKEKHYPSFILNTYKTDDFAIFALRNNPTATKITVCMDWYQDETTFMAADGMTVRYEKINGKWHEVFLPMYNFEYYEEEAPEFTKPKPATFLDRVVRGRESKKQFFRRML